MNDADTKHLGSEILSKGAFLYGTTVVNVVLGYLSLYLAARYIGLQELGIVAYALSFAGIFTFICDFGINRSHTKKVSEGADLQSCLSVYLFLRLGLTTLYVLAMIGVLLAGLDRAEYTGPGNKDHVMLLAVAYYVPALLTSTFVATYLAKRDVIRSQLITVSESVVRIAAISVVVLFGLGVIGLIAAFVASGVGSLLMAFAVSRKSLPRISLQALKMPLIVEYVRFALPLAVAVVVGTIALNIDKVIIQLSLSSEETAIYYGSQRVLGPFGHLGVIMISLVFPAISQLSVHLENRERIGELVSRGLDHILLFLFPVTAFLAVFSREILIALLSVEFAPGATAFAILSIAYALSATTTFPRSQLLGTGVVRAYARLMLFYFIVIIALDVILIPEQVSSFNVVGLGMEGAALSLLVAEGVSMAMFYRYASRESPIAFPGRLPRLAVATGASIALSYAFSLVANPAGTEQVTHIGYLLAYVGIYAVTFIATALAVRATSVPEIRKLMRLLNPLSLKKLNSS